MLQLSLQAQHLGFILDYLRGIVTNDVYTLTRQIDDKIHEFFNEGPDFLISVDVTEEEVMRIFEILTRGPEGVVAAINRDIDADLGPRILAKVEQESELPMPTEEEIAQGAVIPAMPYTQLFYRYMSMKAQNYKSKIERIKSGYALIGLTYTPPSPPAELEPFL